MAGKLDQSLDDILKERRQNARRRPNRRAANGKASPPAPVGGVKKATKPPKPVGKAAPSGSHSGSGESKIIVSNLPTDVTEKDIKEYFSQTIGPVKRVLLTYGPNGQSRGVCTIIFANAGSAAEAGKHLDGVKVDNKPMKIEVIVSAKDVPPPPPAKSLTERIAKQPKPAAKPQPKPATATKANAAKGPGRRGRTKSRTTRGKPKTAEELDAEMQDYFDSGATQAAGGESDTAMVTNGGAVQPAAGGDTGMEDEIM